MFTLIGNISNYTGKSQQFLVYGCDYMSEVTSNQPLSQSWDHKYKNWDFFEKLGAEFESEHFQITLTKIIDLKVLDGHAVLVHFDACVGCGCNISRS